MHGGHGGWVGWSHCPGVELEGQNVRLGWEGHGLVGQGDSSSFLTTVAGSCTAANATPHAGIDACFTPSRSDSHLQCTAPVVRDCALTISTAPSLASELAPENIEANTLGLSQWHSTRVLWRTRLDRFRSSLPILWRAFSLSLRVPSGTSQPAWLRFERQYVHCSKPPLPLST